MSVLYIVTFAATGDTAIMAQTRGCEPVIVTPNGEYPFPQGTPFTCTAYTSNP